MSKNKYPEGLTPHEKLRYRTNIESDTGIANVAGELVAWVDQNTFSKKLEITLDQFDYTNEPVLPGSNQYYVRVKHPNTGMIIRLKRDRVNGSISKDL